MPREGTYEPLSKLKRKRKKIIVFKELTLWEGTYEPLSKLKRKRKKKSLFLRN